MTLRILRVGAGMLLGASGALMYAASWQRWAGACPWGGDEERRCAAPARTISTISWHPSTVGARGRCRAAGRLVPAGPRARLRAAAVGPHRPPAGNGLRCGAGQCGAGPGAVGVATLRSGLTGSVVHPISYDLALYAWAFVPPVLLVRFAFAARGWTLVAAIWLLLATPLVAAFSYAVGSYDARPWWEAISGLLTATAGVCLLGAAAFEVDPGRTRASSPLPRPAPRRGGRSVGHA